MILSYNTLSEAWTHYEYFRCNLASYEKDLSKDLDFIMETRLRVFDETGKTHRWSLGLHARSRPSIAHTPLD